MWLNEANVYIHMYIITLSFKSAVVLGLTFDLQIGLVARDSENTSPTTQSLIDEEIKRLLKVSWRRRRIENELTPLRCFFC